MISLILILVAVGKEGCGCVGTLVLAGLLIFLAGPALVLYLMLGGTILLMRIIGRLTRTHPTLDDRIARLA